MSRTSGNSEPIAAISCEAISAAYRHQTHDPSPAAWRDFFESRECDSQEIVVAEIPALNSSPEAKGRYGSYLAATGRAMAEFGGRMVVTLDILFAGLGEPRGEEGGMAYLARFPSRKAYVQCLMTPASIGANNDRVAALAQSTLVCGRDTMPRIIRLLRREVSAAKYPTGRVKGKDPRQIVDDLLQIYPDGGADPTRAQLERITEMPGFWNEPVYFVNLYKHGSTAQAGAAAHRKYNRMALRPVFAHGARPLARVKIDHHLLGPVRWDLLICPRWPSMAVFTDLRLDPRYIEAQKNRVGAAEVYGNLICHQAEVH